MVPMVVAERVLVQVRLKVLDRNRVIGPADPALDGCPEPLDGVGVDVPAHVDALGMVHAPMRVAETFQVPIGVGLVGLDGGRGKDALLRVG